MSILDKGANIKQVSNFVVHIQSDVDEFFVLINKNTPGIFINNVIDDFGHVEVCFENVHFDEDMKIVTDEMGSANQQQVLEDTYNLILSGSILGCCKRLFASGWGISSCHRRQSLTISDWSTLNNILKPL